MLETLLQKLIELLKINASYGITPLEILTVAALYFIWKQHREERKEWREFMTGMSTRYETLLNENVKALAIIDAKLDKE